MLVNAKLDKVLTILRKNSPQLAEVRLNIEN